MVVSTDITKDVALIGTMGEVSKAIFSLLVGTIRAANFWEIGVVSKVIHEPVDLNLDLLTPAFLADSEAVVVMKEVSISTITVEDEVITTGDVYMVNSFVRVVVKSKRGSSIVTEAKLEVRVRVVVIVIFNGDLTVSIGVTGTRLLTTLLRSD